MQNFCQGLLKKDSSFDPKNINIGEQLAIQWLDARLKIGLILFFDRTLISKV